MLPTFMADPYEPNCGGFYPEAQRLSGLHALPLCSSFILFALARERAFLATRQERVCGKSTSFNPPGFPPEFPWNVAHARDQSYATLDHTV
jgi:hypothetical protein